MAIIKAEKKDVLNPQVKQYFCIVPRRNRTSVVARFIESSPDFYGIVFCQTKILTNEVMEQLVSKGFRANCLHGDMSQSLRNQIIKGFKNKDFNILVATDVAARGIDVSDLTHVINFSLPEEHENYIHRIGRTGRAGKGGIAIVLVAPSEVYRVKRLEKAAKTALQEIPIPSIDTIVNAKMGAVSDFVEQSKEPAKKLSVIHDALNKVIETFTQEEIKQALLIALEDKFFKDISNEKLAPVSHEITDKPQEICMEVGREDGFDEEMIRSYLYVTCKLLPQDARKVRVINRKTFISIPQNKLHECIQAMNKGPITKKRHRIYLVEDSFDGGRGDGRSSRRGGRSSDRSGRGSSDRKGSSKGRFFRKRG